MHLPHCTDGGGKEKAGKVSQDTVLAKKEANCPAKAKEEDEAKVKDTVTQKATAEAEIPPRRKSWPIRPKQTLPTTRLSLLLKVTAATAASMPTCPATAGNASRKRNKE
jgi:hypothetical protein